MIKLVDNSQLMPVEHKRFCFTFNRQRKVPLCYNFHANFIEIISSMNKPVALAHNTFEPSQGVKDDTPIIFIHGIFANKDYWESIPQIVADATQRRAYAVDLRNHGDSEWNDEFSIELNVVDLLNFMDQIGAKKAILVGHSMGGITSMKAALQAGSKVEKIVIEDMSVRIIGREILSFINVYVTAAQNALKSIPPGTPIEKVSELIEENVMKALPPDVQMLTKRRKIDPNTILRPLPDGTFTFKANTEVLRKAMMKHSLALEPSGVFDGPACFIYGEKSPFLVNQDDSIKEYFPRAQLIGIKDAMHGVHTECPEEFTETLLKFLKE